MPPLEQGSRRVQSQLPPRKDRIYQAAVAKIATLSAVAQTFQPYPLPSALCPLPFALCPLPF